MSADGTEHDGHYLDDFLRERLPTLGLDYETYGPYVRGLVMDEDDHDDHNNNDKNMDMDLENDARDNSNWDDILQLLQASSETHADDPEAFCVIFKQELQVRQAKHALELERERNHQREIKLAKEQEQLKQEITLAQQKEAQDLELKQADRSPNEDDDAKRRLVARFEYDESEIMTADGTFVKSQGTDTSEPDNMLPNKEVAIRAHQDKLHQMKTSQSTTSKKEEQQKTKQAKLDKLKQKETRRNRALKGERRR